MSNHQPPYEPYPITPIPLDEMFNGEGRRIVALTVHIELSPDSPPEHDAAALLRALHHATPGDISGHIAEGTSGASALLTIPERPSANPNLLRAITTDALTERQKEVASLMGELTGPEIAVRLGISYETVKSATKGIYERLSIGDRTIAAAKALGLALGFLGTQEEADKYWAEAIVPGRTAPIELPLDKPRPLQPRQREILRSILGGGTVNTLAIEFETTIESMRRSLVALARRFGLDENAGAYTLQKYLQENIAEFDFLQSDDSEQARSE